MNERYIVKKNLTLWVRLKIIASSFIALALGLILPSLVYLIATDYGLPLAIVFSVGIGLVVPVAGITMAVLSAIAIRMFANISFSKPSEFFFWAFFSAIVFYFLASAELHTAMVLNIPFIAAVVGLIALLFISIASVGGALYFVTQRLGVSAMRLGIGISFLIFLIFAIEIFSTPPSAHDICSSLNGGEGEAILEQTLRRYSFKEKTADAFSSSYAYTHLGNQWIILSPGRSCTVTVGSDQTIVMLTEGQDSF